MTKRTLHPPALMAAAALLACLLTLLAASQEAGAAFPGQNGRIVFSSDRDGDFDIYTVRPDGSGLRQLTDAPGSDSNPEWSPDGTKIAFDSDRDGAYDRDVYVMDIATGEVSRLTNDDDPSIPANLEADHSPAFSPDGTRIAFSSNRDTIPEEAYTERVYVMNTDGSELTRLTGGYSHFQSDVSWSPDGTRLLLEWGTDSRYDIGILNADGSGWSFPFPYTPFVDERYPDWSPSSRKIVFTKGTEDRDDTTPMDVWKVNPDGSDLKQLTNTPKVYETAPDWSPDGRLIAFERNGDLLSMRASDGSGKTNLTNTPGHSELDPDWKVKPPR